MCILMSQFYGTRWGVGPTSVTHQKLKLGEPSSIKDKSHLPLEARHWAITLWTDKITRENFLLKMKKRKELMCILMSQAHLGGKHSKCGDRQHYHVYVKLSLSRPKEIFGKDIICLKHWVRPIESRGGNTHAEAVRIGYIGALAVKGQECSKEDGGDEGADSLRCKEDILDCTISIYGTGDCEVNGISSPTDAGLHLRPDGTWEDYSCTSDPQHDSEAVSKAMLLQQERWID